MDVKNKTENFISANVNNIFKKIQVSIIFIVNTIISTQLDAINKHMISTIHEAITNSLNNPQQTLNFNSLQPLSLIGLHINIISQSTPQPTYPSKISILTNNNNTPTINEGKHLSSQQNEFILARPMHDKHNNIIEND